MNNYLLMLFWLMLFNFTMFYLLEFFNTQGIICACKTIFLYEIPEVNQKFEVTLPTEERVVWMWLIIFTYMVPELGTFMRSIRIICFKSWNYPSFWEFFWLFITETLPAVGSAFLVFIIFPELDVIKAAMLTNCVSFIPGFISEYLSFLR